MAVNDNPALKSNCGGFTYKNKRQGAAVLSFGALYILAGIQTAWGILNLILPIQQWAITESVGVVTGAVVIWYVAAACGCLITVLLSYFKLSRIIVNIIVLVIYTIGGIIILSSPTSPAGIWSGRIFTGLGHGIVQVTSLNYAGEIACKELRGSVVSFFFQCTLFGILIFGLFGYLLDATKLDSNFEINRVIGLTILFIVILAIIELFFIRYESPVMLLQMNNHEKALAVFAQLRGEENASDYTKKEFEELDVMVQEDTKDSFNIFIDGNWQPLIYVTLMRFIATMSFNFPLNFIRGLYVFLTLHSHGDLNDNTGQLVLAGIAIITHVILMSLVDVIGRKPLFTLSAGLSGVLLIVGGVVFNNENEYILTSVDKYGVMFIAFEFLCALGARAIPDVTTSEAFAIKKKPLSIAITLVIEHIIHIIITAVTFDKEFTRDYIVGIMIAFGALILIATVALQIVVPETKRTSLRDSTALMKHKMQFSLNGGDPKKILNRTRTVDMS